MILTFSPVRSEEEMTLNRVADVLTINGHTLDMGQIADGMTVPLEAITGDGSEWLAGPISRIDGKLHVALKLPHGWPAPTETLFPQPIELTSNGLVDLPPFQETQDAD